MKRLIAMCLVMAILTVATFAQRKQSNIFSRVPAKTRVRLTERLRLMSELVSKDDRGALYDMTFGPFPQKITKEEFVNYPTSSLMFQILTFTPRVVDRKYLDRYAGASWRILGNVKLRRTDGSEEIKDGTIYAQFRDNEWYLSGIMMTEMRIELKTFEAKEPTKRSD